MDVDAYNIYISILNKQITLLIYKEYVKIASYMFAGNNQLKHD